MMTEKDESSGRPRSGCNALQYEKSPYLLQHAGNPVDWHPWGAAAFEKARREDKPLFLSIGYSTCHWCHVMERESFEDEAVARLLNEGYVPVKVDREERPDIDKVYMSVCQVMTGSGGWPLTVLLTPEGRPFFAGTYFPRTSRQGRIGMLELLPQVSEIWRTRRQELELTAGEVSRSLEFLSEESRGEMPGAGVLDKAFDQFSRSWDSDFGGFGRAPKFPSPHNLMFLLRYWRRTGNPIAREIVESTLDRMRRGGICDHLGGGFHRYSTDRKWRVPHFEKMLYDQALIALAMLEAFQAGGSTRHADSARGIFGYVLRDLAAPGGGFYSAEDADSEGEEGKFYLWSEAEIRAALEIGEAELALGAWNVGSEGNFTEEGGGLRGRNILHTDREPEAIAAELGLKPEDFRRRLEAARGKLLEVRGRRVRPLRDTKILADWNGLMISALARGAQVLGDPGLAAAANRAADFVLREMRDSRGRLLHRWIDGEAAVDGNAEDYAFMVQGLLDLYETGFNPERLEAAGALTRVMLERFWDSAGGFYFTAEDSEALLVRKKELYDGAIPSANSVAALNLLRLARLTGDTRLEDKADSVFRVFAGTVERGPTAYSGFLLALDFALGPSCEVVIAAGSDRTGKERFLAALRSGYYPNKVVLVREPGTALDGTAPFTQGMKAPGGRTAAYVCRGLRCSLPVTEPDEMLKLL